MNKSKIYFFPLIIIIIVTSLSGCTYHPQSTTAAQSEISTNTKLSPTPSMAQLRAKKPTISSSDTRKTVNVTLYISDAECQALIPKQVSVSAVEPVISAVGKIIDEQDSADFSVSGYRVSINNGIATIDLRVSPHSQRQLTSLSNCEQLTLFSSLRKTLTSHSQWKIREVRFTELGKEIST